MFTAAFNRGHSARPGGRRTVAVEHHQGPARQPGRPARLPPVRTTVSRWLGCLRSRWVPCTHGIPEHLIGHGVRALQLIGLAFAVNVGFHPVAHVGLPIEVTLRLDSSHRSLRLAIGTRLTDRDTKHGVRHA